MILNLVASLAMNAVQQDWIEFKGEAGAGKGKRVVFLAGDEEYRSEEGLPQMAKIFAKRHGFDCTVLFSMNDKGEVDPNLHTNQPGMEALDQADLCVMLLRFRAWPDAQMKRFVDYYLAGKPIIALRTSTHPFDYPADSTSAYKRFAWRNKEWPGGFGEQVLGENWISHWGNHGSQATRGIPAPSDKPIPILKGVEDVFGTTDVYEAAPPADARIIMFGEVVAGMSPKDPKAQGRKKTAAGVEQDINDPMMPIAWTRVHKNEAGKSNRIFTCTMGAATDLANEGLRRMILNAAFWATGMQEKIPARANVDLIGDYRPTAFGFEGFKKGLRPSDFGGQK